MKDSEFLSKPMKRGSQVSGPEPYGCFNSGFKPIICRLKSGAYVVGLENDCVEVWEGKLRLALRLGQKTRRIYRATRGRRAWFLKTARSAQEKFKLNLDHDLFVASWHVPPRGTNFSSENEGDSSADMEKTSGDAD